MLRMEEPPTKRQRVDDVLDKKDEWDPVVPTVGDEMGPKYLREVDVGITEHVDQSFAGFDCILKYRYLPRRVCLTSDTPTLWSKRLD